MVGQYVQTVTTREQVWLMFLSEEDILGKEWKTLILNLQYNTEI